MRTYRIVTNGRKFKPQVRWMYFLWNDFGENPRDTFVLDTYDEVLKWIIERQTTDKKWVLAQPEKQ